jgi:hypothetical protein
VGEGKGSEDSAEWMKKVHPVETIIIKRKD